MVTKVTLLRLNSSVSEDVFAVLDEAAGAFGDNGGDPDGGLWLQETSVFSANELAAALAAGAEIVNGWRADYHAGPDHETNPRWHMDAHEYCGYAGAEEVYTLDRKLAEVFQRYFDAVRAKLNWTLA